MWVRIIFNLLCVVIEPWDRKEICSVSKQKGSVFEPVFYIKLRSMPLEEQKRVAKAELDYVDDRIKKKAGTFNTLPFNIAPLKFLKEKISALKLKQFIDPQFPPNETSLFDKTYGKKYPYQ